MHNVTDLLKKTFVTQFVFPVLGREDSPDPARGLHHHVKEYSKLADLWKHWLPSDALTTFTSGKNKIFFKNILLKIAVFIF